MSKKADAYASDTSILFFCPRNFFSDGLFTFMSRRFVAPEDLWRYKDEEEEVLED
jgi:hypothetical protein